MDALTKGIEKAGGLGAFASALSRLRDDGRVFTPQTVNGWRIRHQIPLDAVWTVSAYTGIPVWEIRPDVYDRPEVYLAKTANVCQVDRGQE